MVKYIFLIAGILILFVLPLHAEVYLDGFLQGLYGGHLNDKNPAAADYPASESRFQLRAEHYGDNAEMYAKLDFVYDGADSSLYSFELREAFAKFQLGGRLDFKVGRQIITWGVGDLVFINDVFAKDYRSFFVGRDQQYLKAPQNSIRLDYYPGFADLSLVWTPRFESNRLPTGRNLSYYNPMAGTITGEGYYFDPPLPAAEFKNGELAARLSRLIGGFNYALYFYTGFYKNPIGSEMTPGVPVPVFPKLNVYGFSTRGQLGGGILWFEAGYFDSRQDRDGNNPMMPNSSVSALAGYEKQVATNLTVNLQWKIDRLFDYDTYKAQLLASGQFVKDESRHTITSRVTQLLNSELLQLSGFVFYSPSDEDLYLRLLAEYKYTDEIKLAVGGNIFAGSHPETDFGQFRLNDNTYIKVTYGF
jgi:hypothetical protein